MADGNNQEILLRNVRITWIENLWEAGQYQGKGAFKHSATFLIEKDTENFKAVEAAINAAAKAQFGKDFERKLKLILPDPKACCWQDGDLRDYDGYAGCYALAAKRDAKKQGAPKVIHNRRVPGTDPKRPFVEISEADGTLYAGCYVNAKVQIWAQGGDTPGIRATLLTVQYWSGGDAFSGGSKPTEAGFEEGGDLADTGIESDTDSLA